MQTRFLLRLSKVCYYSFWLKFNSYVYFLASSIPIMYLTYPYSSLPSSFVTFIATHYPSTFDFLPSNLLNYYYLPLLFCTFLLCNHPFYLYPPTFLSLPSNPHIYHFHQLLLLILTLFYLQTVVGVAVSVWLSMVVGNGSFERVGRGKRIVGKR